MDYSLLLTIEYNEEYIKMNPNEFKWDSKKKQTVRPIQESKKDTVQK